MCRAISKTSVSCLRLELNSAAFFLSARMFVPKVSENDANFLSNSLSEIMILKWHLWCLKQFFKTLVMTKMAQITLTSLTKIIGFPAI